MKFGTHVDIGLDNILRYGATEEIPPDCEQFANFFQAYSNILFFPVFCNTIINFSTWVLNRPI